MKRTSIIITLGLMACAGEVETPQVALLETDTPTLEVEVMESATAPDVEVIASTEEAEILEEIWSVYTEETPLKEEVATTDNLLVMFEFDLRRGETLAHFARWSGLTVETIADSSNLSLNGTYPVGTRITLPLLADEVGQIETNRDEHHIKRVEGYLASRGGSSGSEFYQVRSGDNAWVIARSRYGIPVWLLEAYNPSTDLDSIRPGQELMIPVIDDVVVSAD
jgi:LysM repeat protein